MERYLFTTVVYMGRKMTTESTSEISFDEARWTLCTEYLARPCSQSVLKLLLCIHEATENTATVTTPEEMKTFSYNWI